MPSLDLDPAVVLTWLQDHVLDVVVFAAVCAVGAGITGWSRRLVAALRAREELPDGARAALLWVPRFLGVITVLVALDASHLAPVSVVFGFVRDLLDAKLFRVQDRDITPMTFVTLAAVVVVTLQVSQALQRALALAMKRRTDVDEGVQLTLGRLVHYAVMALGIAVGLQTAGFDLTAILAASTVFAVGLGFGFQTLANNFISGLMLMLEQAIRPGDYLTIEGRVVRVEELGIRATIARTLDDDRILIPNAKLIENNVVNHSFGGDPVIRARAVVGVAYESDLDQVLRVLEEAARKVPGRATHRQPVVFLLEFADSSIVFEVSIWVRHAFERPKLLSALRMAIWRAFETEGITIAFPQIDVHLDPRVEDALHARPTAPEASAEG